MSATPDGEIGVKKAPPAHGLMGAAAKVREAQRTVWPIGFAIVAALVAAISAALAAMTGRIQAQPAWMIISAAASGLILLLAASFFAAGKNTQIRTAAKAVAWCFSLVLILFLAPWSRPRSD